MNPVSSFSVEKMSKKQHGHWSKEVQNRFKNESFCHQLFEDTEWVFTFRPYFTMICNNDMSHPLQCANHFGPSPRNSIQISHLTQMTETSVSLFKVLFLSHSTSSYSFTLLCCYLDYIPVHVFWTEPVANIFVQSAHTTKYLHMHARL